MGFLLLLVLSLLAAAAALAIVSRARLPGRAQVTVAVTLLWNALVILPIYVLGLLNVLTAQRLAVASAALSLAAGAAACHGVGVRATLAEVGRLARGQLRLPMDALVMSWRARSLIFVGVLFAAILLPYLAMSAYLGQPLPHWDPLWYHDTMVGFTIQNHGFVMMPALPETLQKVNGYVRLGEMTQLWMVVFADRRLADITNLLFAPAIATATYALARRYAEPVIAIGWAVAVVISPTCAGLLQSTYVDPQYGALLLGAVLFATVDQPRIADGLLGGLALALTLGSKGLALVPVPVIGVIGAWALLRAHWYDRRRAAIATVAGGIAAVLLVGATTYLRNYWTFHNPLWPDMRVDIDALGIHWPGLGPWLGDSSRPGGQRVNVNEPLPSLLDHLYALPWSVKGMYFDQAIEYGIGFIWIVIPLGVAAFFACWVQAIRLRGAGATAAPAVQPPTRLALIMAAIVAGSPALWGPRYHIGGMGVLMALAAWLTGRPPRDRLGEAAAGAVLVMSLMMFWWTPAPRWWYSPEQLLKLAQASPVEREVDRDLGAPTLRPAGLARELELGPGKKLVFTDRYSGFPSIFWNRSFSNFVQYLPMGPDFLVRAARVGATWIYVLDPGLIAQARAPHSGWQEVGSLNAINGGGLVFRRVPVNTPPTALPAPPAPARPVIIYPHALAPGAIGPMPLPLPVAPKPLPPPVVLPKPAPKPAPTIAPKPAPPATPSPAR